LLSGVKRTGALSIARLTLVQLTVAALLAIGVFRVFDLVSLGCDSLVAEGSGLWICLNNQWSGGGLGLSGYDQGSTAKTNLYNEFATSSHDYFL
jgi:hypothetical protein